MRKLMEHKGNNTQPKTIKHEFLRTQLILSIVFMTLSYIIISSVYLINSISFYEDMASERLNYINSQVEHFAATVKNYSKTLIVNDTIQKSMRDCATDMRLPNIQEGNKIRKEIINILQSTPFVHSVAIYNSEGMLLVSTERAPELGKYIDVSDINNEHWIDTEKNSSIYINAKDKVIAYLAPFYNAQSGKLIGYMELSVPNNIIKDIYSDSINEYNNMYMIDRNERCIIGHSTINNNEQTTNHYNKTVIDNGQIYFISEINSLGLRIINEVRLIHFIKPLIISSIIVFIIFTIMLIICVLTTRLISNSLTSSFEILIKHIKNIRDGEWKEVDYTDSLEYADINLLINEFNNMIRSKEDMTIDLLNAQEAKNTLSAELIAQQTNPHFLYNSLDNIYSLSLLGELDQVSSLALNLSTFYRKSLSKGRNIITLREELELTRAYLEIMKIRYYDMFEYSIFCEDGLEECVCLKLLMQPIVENSIYHGIKEVNYKGYIDIIVVNDSDSLSITIQDNGKGCDCENIMQPNNNSHHFGIMSVDKRIKLYYGATSGLKMSPRSPYGCKTIINMPMEIYNERTNSR